MSALTYGNGLNGMIGYDNQYRVKSITAGAVMNLSYPTYDANDNIKAINDILDATKNKAFDYDALDRLSTATSSGIWGSLGWTYDGVGNRQTENSNTYTYFANSNKLNSANGKSFGYDNNGNTVTESSRQYTYNQNQRLIQVVEGAMTANYLYNGFGQRVKKVVNGTTTFFHYDLRGQLIAESNSAGSITAEYVYLNSQPLAKIEGANVYYYHNDHLATPQKMTDGSGTVVWAADYKPFGEATITVSTITNNLRFPGQYYDAETGLSYNYFRDYNPAIGRYVQADPVGLWGGINLYIYVGANPLYWYDLSGLARKKGKTPNDRWPKPPENACGKKPKWNPDGYWEGKNGRRLTWDDRTHGAGVDRGEGAQDGHWDDETSDNRWDRDGNLLPGSQDAQSTSNICQSQPGMCAGVAVVVIVVVLTPWPDEVIVAPALIGVL